MDRAKITGGPGATIWLTGLSGSGKSTIAVILEKALHDSGRATYILDGDNLRHGLNGDLGFSDDDRRENVRRVGEVARLMNDAGLVVIVPVIAPFEKSRNHIRAIHGSAGLSYMEVFVDTPLEICEQRDPKGLYRKARAGELKGMTGVDSPYEAPLDPDLVIDGAVTSAESAVERIIQIIPGH